MRVWRRKAGGTRPKVQAGFEEIHLSCRLFSLSLLLLKVNTAKKYSAESERDDFFSALAPLLYGGIFFNVCFSDDCMYQALFCVPIGQQESFRGEQVEQQWLTSLGALNKSASHKKCTYFFHVFCTRCPTIMFSRLFG